MKLGIVDILSVCLITACIVLQIVSYNGNIGAILGWVVALSSTLTAINLKSKLEVCK